MVSPSPKKPEPMASTAVTGKPRAVYRCKQCGLPAKGHDCAFRYQQGSSIIKTKPTSKPKTIIKPHHHLLVRRKQPPHAEAKERKRRRERQQQQQHQQQQQGRTKTGRKMERDNDDDEAKERKRKRRREQQEEQESGSDTGMSSTRTDRKMERDNSNDDDDGSWFSLSTTETDERRARGRRAAPAYHLQQQQSNRKRLKQNTTSTTEVLMAMHIFQDQVHAHRQVHDLFHTNNSKNDDASNSHSNNATECDLAEERFLTTWSRLATQQFHQQNLAVVQNIELVAQRRQLGKRVKKERNALVALRSKIRRVQAECTRTEQELAVQRQQKSTRRAASRFLNAIDRCQK
jgi:hypothetical protein